MERCDFKMKLSIFKEAKHLPTKEEKSKAARFTSKPYTPEVKDFTTGEDLIDIITSYTYSPFIFKEFRREKDFVSTDLLIFDIDENQLIEDVEKIVHRLDLVCLVMPTTSHTPEHHRFRVILPLSKTITDPETYKTTFSKYAEYFSIDPACSDLARVFFGSTKVDGFLYNGKKLLEPEKAPQKSVNSPKADYSTKDSVVVGESLEELVLALYGETRTKIPESVAYFLENAHTGLPGEAFVRSNSFVFTCALQGLEEERIKEVFYSLFPHEITSVVEKAVDKVIEQGYNAREDNEEL